MKAVTDKKLILKLALLLLWGLACWLFFQLAYPHHLYYQEQDQLFLLSSDYLSTYFSKPGWLACMAGDFLTQFYYYVFAGATILTVVLLVFGDLLCRVLQRAGITAWPAFIVAMAAMTFEACQSFNVEYKLSSIIALTGGALAFFLVNPIAHSKRWWVMALDYAACLVVGWLTFVLFGSGALLYMLLLLVQACCRRTWQSLMGSIGVTLALQAVVMTSRERYMLPTDDLFTYPGLGKLQKPDFLLEKTLAAADEYAWGHYQKVISMVEKEGEETTDGEVFYYNLAQAQLGHLPENLLRMKQPYLGTFEKIGPETPRLTINLMNDLYFALGDMMFTERAAMLRAVFSPDNRSVKMTKRLAECNIVSGDTLAATKYLRLLQKTFVYRDWADRAMAGDRSAIGYLLAKQPYVNRKDTLRTSDNAHLIMMELLDSNPHNELCLDYLLCSDLLLRDITTFKRDYDRYCMPDITAGKPGDAPARTIAPAGRIRPLYQQALMIWLAGTQAPQEEWQRYIKDGEQFRRFQEYNQQRGSSAFADTYWYYFDTRSGK